MRKRRAIALLRVSTDQQDNARQRTHIEYLKKTFHLEIVEIIELDGVSGRKVLKDPRFLKVLDDLRHRPDVDGLAISAIDRFFRTDRYDDTQCFQPLADGHKLIWSKVEGEVDPSTAAGFNICMTAALKSGAEWRTLRDRTMEGKEELRAEGKHVNGDASLPRGIAYDKATEKWSYQEPDCSRVARMFPLFLEGCSLHVIARTVGGGWSYQGVKCALRNRIWAFGERVYPADSRREQPLVVKVIDTPLVSPEVWQRVQDLLDGRSSHWLQTRRPTRFLLSGLLRCKCGKPCYLRARSRNSSHDTYICSSRHPNGPGCGMRRVWRESVDETVVRLIQDCFESPKKLIPLVEAIKQRAVELEAASPAAQPGSRGRLESRRERILEQRADGLITREQCIERVGLVDRELAALANPPRQLPEIDPRILLEALANIFFGFDGYSFDHQRGILQSVCREVVLADNAIVSVTLKGVKLNSRSTWPYWRQFPMPVRSGQQP